MASVAPRDAVTKSDLRDMLTEFQTNMQSTFRQEMNGMKADVVQEVANIFKETKEEFAKVREENRDHD